VTLLILPEKRVSGRCRCLDDRYLVVDADVGGSSAEKLGWVFSTRPSATDLPFTESCFAIIGLPLFCWWVSN
jgi:hypothetical protein